MGNIKLTGVVMITTSYYNQIFLSWLIMFLREYRSVFMFQHILFLKFVSTNNKSTTNNAAESSVVNN